MGSKAVFLKHVCAYLFAPYVVLGAHEERMQSLLEFAPDFIGCSALVREPLALVRNN